MPLDVKALQRRYSMLKDDRTGWDKAWDELAELFLPCRYRQETDTASHRSPRLNGRLVNSTGVLAMRTLAAGMQGGMTSPVRPWFRLRVRDDEGGENASGLGAWLEEVTNRMQIVLHESNFYNAIHGLYSDLGTFGTGLMIETADAEGVQFHLVRAGEYFLDINAKGEVDTFFRRLYMTGRQIRQQWGEANLPDVVKRAAKSSLGEGATQRFDVIHAVFPREDAERDGQIGPKSKAFCSVYWMPESSMNGKPVILDEGGYDTFPAFAPRWDVNGTDVYGRSPAMDVTPDLRMLQLMTATFRKLQHKIAEPAMLVDAELQQFGVNLSPNALNFVDMGSVMSKGEVPVTPIYQPDVSTLTALMNGITQVEKTVNEGLYTDLFRMMVDDDRRQITATEISARQQEKMILIGPVVERLQKELLSPLIHRTYQLMLEWGALPPAPEGVEAGALDVSFESVLATAQRITATSAIDQGFTFIVNVAAADPSAIDILDTDNMLRDYLDRLGMPEGCIRDDDAVRQIRQQKQQAQQESAQQEQLSQMGQTAADLTGAAKNLGQTPVGADGQTLMSTLLGGLNA